MTPDEQQERWIRIKDIFGQAIEHVPEMRRGFILAKCRDDADMCEETLALLDAYECRQEFADHPVFGFALRALFAHHAGGHIGEIFGGYRIVREIGSGGMGAVYLGVRDDEAFEKQVAVKIVNEYAADPEYLNRRLCAERAILAKLDHPNIARLIDGGTTETGLPYFIMEFVQGKPLTAYCDERGLNLRERLELFRGVCAAIHYSHRNFIIHRDLKPGNILVTDAGVPKLLDFGIAKLLAEDHARASAKRTTTIHRAMTPTYASPEQVHGDPVTTASDVYSLGVVLYELLTGHLPYRFPDDSPQAVERVIRHVAPVRPSVAAREAPESGESGSVKNEVSRIRLSRELEGDLDAILLCALRKDSTARYASAERFSEDIERYLNGLPVSALAHSRRYLVGKFLRRYRFAVAAGLTAALSLAAATGISLYQSRVARTERERAEIRFQETWRLAKSNIFELHDAIERLPGSTAARGLLVRQSLDYLERLDREAGTDPKFRRELGLAYLRVGEVQGRPYSANLGDVTGAMASYRKGLGHLEAAAASTPSDPECRRDLSIGYERLGELAAYRMHHFQEAGTYFDKALAIRTQLADIRPQTEENRLLLASIQICEGDLRNMQGDPLGALEWFTKARAGLEMLVAEVPKHPLPRRRLAAAYQRTVYCLRALGDAAAAWGQPDWATDFYLDALRLHEQALKIRRELAGEDPNNPALNRAVADSLVDSGELNGRLRRTEASVREFRSALAMFQSLSAADPTNRELSIDTVSLLARFGATAQAAGDDALGWEIRGNTAEILKGIGGDGSNRELSEWFRWLDTETVRLSAKNRDATTGLAACRRLEAGLMADRSGEPVAGAFAGLLKPYRAFGDTASADRIQLILKDLLAGIDPETAAVDVVGNAAIVLLDEDNPALFDPKRALVLARAWVKRSGNPWGNLILANALKRNGETAAARDLTRAALHALRPDADLDRTDARTEAFLTKK